VSIAHLILRSAKRRKLSRAMTTHILKINTSRSMAVRLAHAVRMAFHRFQRGSKASRTCFRIVSLIVLGASF
jgi:hypothetical protein